MEYFKDNFEAETERCSSWGYDKSVWHNTIVQQWNLVCDRSVFVSTASALYQLGVMFGVFTFGLLADKIGRKWVAIVTLIVWAVSGVTVAFSSSIVMFMAFKFIVAFADMACQNACFVLCQESLSVVARNTWGVLVFLAFSLGVLILTIVAYFLRDWVYIQLLSMLPVLLSAVLIVTRIESPEWMMSVGKLDEAVVNMKKISKLNKVELPEDYEMVSDILQSKKSIETENSSKSVSVLDLIRTKNMRKRTIAGAVIGFTTTSAYYSFTFNMSDLGGNLFANMAASAVLEMVGLVAIVVAMNKIGRRLPIITSLFLASACLTASIFVPKDILMLKIGVSILGRTFFSMINCTILTYVTEFTPTVLRSMGLSTCIMAAFTGSTLAPYVHELGLSTNEYVPFILYGCLSMVSCCMAFMLPETLNRQLPRTIEEAENFQRRQKTKTELMLDRYSRRTTSEV